MKILHFPWLEASIAVPLIGSFLVRLLASKETVYKTAVMLCGASLLLAIGAWLDFGTLHSFEALDRWDLVAWATGDGFFVVDEFSAPLIPLVALVFFATTLGTLRTKASRFSFADSLLNQAIVLATFSCNNNWGIVFLLTVGTFIPAMDLIRRQKPLRVYLIHMTLFVGLLVVGQLAVENNESVSPLWLVGCVFVMLAGLLRSGVFPFHVWVTDLFEQAALGTAILTVTPLVGTYAVVRLVLPIAPEWLLQTMAFASIFTAVYASGMALVQTDARRFFCFLYLSHASLILVGFEMLTVIGLTGALCVWLSVTLALTGLGLTLRSLESRWGRITLNQFHGYAEQTPLLGAFFLVTGLASAGFPGTFGFVGTELLVNGVLDRSPVLGGLVVLIAMLNGIVVVQVYFRVFAGTRHVTLIPMNCRRVERYAVLTLTCLILIGGFYAQPGISSRYHAAVELMKDRQSGLTFEPHSVNTQEGSESLPEHDLLTVRDESSGTRF